MDDNTRREMLNRLERAAEVFRASHPAFPPLQSDVILDGWAPERVSPRDAPRRSRSDPRASGAKQAAEA